MKKAAVSHVTVQQRPLHRDSEPRIVRTLTTTATRRQVGVRIAWKSVIE
jgi:hypothetical protein